MATRKPKESLIAEIPKPRLTDEELMELFYGGERKAPPGLDKADGSSASSENVSVLDTNTQTKGGNESIKPPNRQPSTEEPYVNEPSQKKPSYTEPIFKKPIIEAPLDAGIEKEILGSHFEILSENFNIKNLEDTAAHPESYAPVEESKRNHFHSTTDSPVDITTRDQATGKVEGLSTGPLKKGSFKEGYTEEGLSPFYEHIQTGHILKKAFDVLPMLSPFEQLVYLWFLNLSYELGRESCRVTMSILQRATGISEKLVRETLRSLLRNGCLHLLDGGAAGKAALYRVTPPHLVAEEVMKNKGPNKKGSLEKGSETKPSEEEPIPNLPSTGNLSERNLPSHIERESYSYTLSVKKEHSPWEPFAREGSLNISLPVKIADNVVDRFYSMIGQTRISRQKRERSRSQLLDLMQQGFQIDDVLYAIEWARRNISGPIHSFGLIPEVIGQALSRRVASSHEKARSEGSSIQRSPDSDVQVEKEQKEHARLEGIFESLPMEEQDALRTEALRFVVGAYGANVPGQQTLVRIKLMELLRERYAEKVS